MPQPQQSRIGTTSVTYTTDQGNGGSLNPLSKARDRTGSSWILLGLYRGARGTLFSVCFYSYSALICFHPLTPTSMAACPVKPSPSHPWWGCFSPASVIQLSSWSSSTAVLTCLFPAVECNSLEAMNSILASLYTPNTCHRIILWWNKENKTAANSCNYWASAASWILG